MAGLAADRGEGPLAGFITKIERPSVPGARYGDERSEESFIREVHKAAANITLMLVLLHVAGVGIASFAHRENLSVP